MTRDFVPRPDGSRARQFADSTWLVENADGRWHIEAPDLPDIPVPAAEVYAATFSIHGFVNARVWQEHRRRTLPEPVDEAVSVALARALAARPTVEEVAA